MKMTVNTEKVKSNRTAKLKAALKTLGTGKNKVAASLKEKKIKGVRGSMIDCPVANYVKKLFPKSPCSVEVNVGDICVEFDDGVDLSLNPPHAVDTFIDAFDGGSYDFLSEED